MDTVPTAILVMGILLVAPAAPANTFNGGGAVDAWGDHDWADPDNWSGDEAPVSGASNTRAFIHAASSSLGVTGSTHAYVTDWSELENTSHVNVHDGGTFEAAGHLYAMSNAGRVNAIYVYDGGTLTGGASVGGRYRGDRIDVHLIGYANMSLGTLFNWDTGCDLYIEGYDSRSSLQVSTLKLWNNPEAYEPGHLRVTLDATTNGGNFNTVNVTGSATIHAADATNVNAPGFELTLGAGAVPVTGEVYTLLACTNPVNGEFDNRAWDTAWTQDDTTFVLRNEHESAYGVFLEVTTGGPPSLPGDANRDGIVDLQDFGTLKDNFALTVGATWEMGDFNGDGAVDLQDFGILKDHFAPVPSTHKSSER